MKIEIEPTSEILELDGVPVRRWKGRTEDGIECEVFVKYVAVLRTEDESAFRRELTPMPPPQHIVPQRRGNGR